MIRNGDMTEDEERDFVRIIEKYCDCRQIIHPQYGPAQLVCPSHQWLMHMVKFPGDFKALLFERRRREGMELRNRDCPAD